MNDILADQDTNNKLWAGFGMKNLNFFSVRLHGVQRDHLKVQGTQYFYPGEIWNGEEVMGRAYSDQEVLDLLYDLGNKS